MIRTLLEPLPCVGIVENTGSCRHELNGRSQLRHIVLRDTESTMTLSDTSPRAAEVYFRRLAEMTPSERLNLGAALWAAGDSLQRSAARRMFPDADETEINFRIAVSRYGEELARRAYRKL